MGSTGVPDTWERKNPYENHVSRWSHLVAPKFLSWLKIPGGGRWLDVGAGTGALCAAIADHCSPSSIIGVEPSEGFLQATTASFSGRGPAPLTLWENVRKLELIESVPANG